jgi:hypothetical protein
VGVFLARRSAQHLVDFDYPFGIFKHFFSNKTNTVVAIINVVAENV